MRNYLQGAFLIGVVGLLPACDRSPYESAPVTLKSNKGSVICQLYTVDRVMWDQSIQVPDGMTKEEGDALCLAEGIAQQKAARAKS